MKRTKIVLVGFLATITVLFFLAQSGARAENGSFAPGEHSEQVSSLVFLPMAIRPPAVGRPVIHSFAAKPATIEPGGSATLTWQVTGATSLSISPGIGAVSGTSIRVSPANTTSYILSAVNASGSATAEVTVTVMATPPPSAGFFIVPTRDIELPTSHPTVRVDPTTGGVHVVYTSESTTESNPVRPAYYAYCPANCNSAAAFTIVSLGDGVDFAALALDPAGRPRVLLRVPVEAQSGNIFLFQYWMCNSNCQNRAQWGGDSIGYSYARPVGWVEPFIHSFALDHLGRPRFVYYDNGADYNDSHWGAFYAYCDANCTSPTNWYETRLLDDMHASDFALAFSGNGQPRLAYTSHDGDTLAQPLVYAECNQACGDAANWSASVLAETASASVSHFATYSLAVNTAGKPRLALYTGTGTGGSLAPNTLYYLACEGANCADPGSWTALNLNLPQTHGEEGVALALDVQNRPRIAYHAPMAAGFGLHYTWCNADCEASAETWQIQEMEPSEEVNEELPIPPWSGCPFPECDPPIPPCTISFWDTGVRPSLALDDAGNPRLAYDANHEQGGACGTFTDTKLTRFIRFNQP